MLSDLMMFCLLFVDLFFRLKLLEGHKSHLHVLYFPPILCLEGLGTCTVAILYVGKPLFGVKWYLVPYGVCSIIMIFLRVILLE